MVLFTWLLNRVHVLQILCLIWTEKHGSEKVNINAGRRFGFHMKMHQVSWVVLSSLPVATLRICLNALTQVFLISLL